MDLQSLYNENLHLLAVAGIQFTEYDHEPVLTYHKAAEIRARYSLEGVESKSLFLKLKDGPYAMYISIEGSRFDPGVIKSLLGRKPSLCPDDELSRETGCHPQAACPFGYPESIVMIVDEKIFEHEMFIYSPGPPEKTIQISTQEVRLILEQVKNPVVYCNSQGRD